MNFYVQAAPFWQEYTRYRPVYPDELYKIIFDYHFQHCKDDSLAVDYGSGPGTIIPALLSRFSKAIGTDMNADQIQVGKIELQSQFGKERVEMRQGAAGKCDWLQDESASIITAAEAVHWFDVELWMKEVDRVLIRGGTLAFWFYPPNAVLVNASPRANECISGLFHEALAPMTENFMKKAPQQGIYAAACSVLQLDNIRIDSRLFTNEERHKWQHSSPRDEVTGIEPRFSTYTTSVQSQVGDEARIVDHKHTSEGPFLQRKQWTVSDLLHYIDTLGMTIPEEYIERAAVKQYVSDLLKEVGGKEGKIDVAWWTSLVLATKR